MVRAAFDNTYFSVYKYSKLRCTMLILTMICGMHYEPLLANVLLCNMPYTVVAIGYSLGIFGRGAACGNDQCVCNLGSGFLSVVMAYVVLAINEVFL